MSALRTLIVAHMLPALMWKVYIIACALLDTKEMALIAKVSGPLLSFSIAFSLLT